MKLETLKQIGSQLLHLPQALQEAKDLGLTRRTRKHAPLEQVQQGGGVKPRRQMPRFVAAMRIAAEEQHPKVETKGHGGKVPVEIKDLIRKRREGINRVDRMTQRALQRAAESTELELRFLHPEGRSSTSTSNDTDTSTASGNWK